MSSANSNVSADEAGPSTPTMLSNPERLLRQPRREPPEPTIRVATNRDLAEFIDEDDIPDAAIAASGNRPEDNAETEEPSPPVDDTANNPPADIAAIAEHHTATSPFHDKSSNGSRRSHTETTLSEEMLAAIKAETDKQAKRSIAELQSNVETVLTHAGYPTASTLNDTVARASAVEDAQDTLTRVVSAEERKLNEVRGQLKHTVNIESVNAAIENSVAAAVDGGVMHAMERQSLDAATTDDEFLTALSTAFLRHAGTRKAITRFTTALVEQAMNDYLASSGSALTPADPQRQPIIANMPTIDQAATTTTRAGQPPLTFNHTAAPSPSEPSSSDSSSEEDYRPRRKPKKQRNKRRIPSSDESDSSYRSFNAPVRSETDASSDSSYTNRTSRRRHARRNSTNKKGRTDPNVRVLRPVNDDFRRATDYRMYRLQNTSTKYGRKHAKKIASQARSLKVQMSSLVFRGTDPISILTFLETFRFACDANGVHEGAAMWLFSFFMEGRPKSNLVNKLSDATDSRSMVSERLTSYTSVVNYLLSHYASDEIIAEADQGIKSLRQLPGQSPVKFAEVLSAKALRCGHVYTETTLIMIFTDGLDKNIKGQVRRYWSDNRRTTFDSLARYAKSLTTHLPTEPDQSTRSNRINTMDGRRQARNDNRSGSQDMRGHDRPVALPIMPPPTPKAYGKPTPTRHAQPSSHRGTSHVDRLNQCRFCFAPSTDHLSSQCPHINEADRTALIKVRDDYFKNIAEKRNNRAVSFDTAPRATPRSPPPPGTSGQDQEN